MDSPTAIVKSALQPGLIFKTAIVVVVIMLIAEATGFTSWILAPISSWKNRKAS